MVDRASTNGQSFGWPLGQFVDEISVYRGGTRESSADGTLFTRPATGSESNLKKSTTRLLRSDDLCAMISLLQFFSAVLKITSVSPIFSSFPLYAHEEKSPPRTQIARNAMSRRVCVSRYRA